jgi:hypothetical protein
MLGIEGVGGEMTQALYAHMNNKTIKKRKKKFTQSDKLNSKFSKT